MKTSHFPPQAYTTETLTAAHNWMLEQSPATRELAKDTDTLVSLFRQAQRINAIKNKRTTDESFKENLKNLAEGVKQFDGEVPEDPLPIVDPPKKSSVYSPLPGEPNVYSSELSSFASPPITPKEDTLYQVELQVQRPIAKIIKNTRKTLNLNSDQEAIFALISMGHQNLKSLFPK